MVEIDGDIRRRWLGLCEDDRPSSRNSVRRCIETLSQNHNSARIMYRVWKTRNTNKREVGSADDLGRVWKEGAHHGDGVSDVILWSGPGCFMWLGVASEEAALAEQCGKSCHSASTR